MSKSTYKQGSRKAHQSNRRTPVQRMFDKNRISDLHLQGYSPNEIVGILNREEPDRTLSLRQVQYDIDQLKEEWQRSSVFNFNEARNRELAKIDSLEREYWRAWRKSWESLTIDHKEQYEDSSVGKQSVERKRMRRKQIVEDRIGEVRYLEGVQWCISERCRILGLHTPERHEIDWRIEARKAGIDDEATSQFENMVAKFVEELGTTEQSEE